MLQQPLAFHSVWRTENRGQISLYFSGKNMQWRVGNEKYEKKASRTRFFHASRKLIRQVIVSMMMPKRGNAMEFRVRKLFNE